MSIWTWGNNWCMNLFSVLCTKWNIAYKSYQMTSGQVLIINELQRNSSFARFIFFLSLHCSKELWVYCREDSEYKCTFKSPHSHKHTFMWLLRLKAVLRTTTWVAEPRDPGKFGGRRASSLLGCQGLILCTEQQPMGLCSYIKNTARCHVLLRRVRGWPITTTEVSPRKTLSSAVSR